MMKWTRNMLLMPVLMVQALSSCSLIDEPIYDDADSSVKASLAFTVSSAAGATTRMADVVVQEQENGRSYRGLGKVYMIPFAIQGDKDAIESSNHPSRLFELGGDEGSPYSYTSNKSSNYGGFYLYNAYSMVRGVNAFLVYGRASTALTLKPSGVSDKAFYGSLQFNESELINPNLETLQFKTEAMCPGTTAPSEATLLAKYLTHIANADGWSTTSDQTLKLLYKVFTGQENDGNIMVMAGASVNVMEHVNALYALLSELTFTGSEANVKTNIINCIKGYTAEGLTFTNNGETGNNWRLKDIKTNDKYYPAKYDLPDGAAALCWGKIPNTTSDYGFVPQTVTTTLADINSINRFCYPPELFYYANSRIYTSNKDNFQGYQSKYQDETDWSGVLAYYENKDAMVTGNTKGIAIQKPLQYAVGRLKVSLKKVDADALNDNAGKTIPLTNSSSEASFPLTGIIICNQHPVGFSFEPVDANGAESHAEDQFIYDSQVGTSCHLSENDNKSIPSTLVLQSYGGEEVLIALEFQNNSGTDFRGKGGVIYPGTKFYLMGKIKPDDYNTENSASVPAEVKTRVFTRDYVTTVSTKVVSLANAYNVLPNMLGGRLELGVELVPNWIQAKTTNVILE